MTAALINTPVYKMSNIVKKIYEMYENIPFSTKARLALAGINTEVYEEELPDVNSEPYRGVLPKDLDSLSISDISDLMSAHVIWTRYVQGLLSDATVKLNCSQQILNSVKSALIKEVGKDSYEFNEDYLKAMCSYQEASAVKTYLESAQSMCNQNYKVLSRLITLRGQDQDTSSRLSNIQRSGNVRPWESGDED